MLHLAHRLGRRAECGLRRVELTTDHTQVACGRCQRTSAYGAEVLATAFAGIEQQRAGKES